MPRVNERGPLIADEKLIERNGRFPGPYGDAEDLWGDFIDTGFHGGLLRTEGYTVCAYSRKPARCIEPGKVLPTCIDRVKSALWAEAHDSRYDYQSRAAASGQERRRAAPAGA